MPTMTSTLAVKLLDGISGPAKGAAASLAGIGKAGEALAKVRGFREATARLDEMSRAHAKARENVRNMASALMAAESPSARMQSAYARATAAADRLGNRLEWQKARVRGAADALAQIGVNATTAASAESRLTAQVQRATAALERQAAARRRLGEIGGSIASGAGIIAANRGRQFGKNAIVSAAEFDIGVRKQREFLEISENDQQRLLKQATKIGQETPFSNLDVVRAQTKAAQGLPETFGARLRAEVAEGIVENVKNFALVMETDLEEGAETIRSYLQAAGRDISTKEKALKEANRATNQLVAMAKLGGMSGEDVSQFIKFSASSATTAGLSPETLMSLGVLARRGGLRGDEAGVFMRSTASKLVSPTQKGRAALRAAGIDFDAYRSPANLDGENIEAQFRNDLGRGFDEKTRRRVAEIAANPEMRSDQAKFVEAITQATSGLFQPGKNGQIRAADRAKIAKSARTAHGAAGGKVDTERLLDDAMSKGMTLAQLNAWLTDKHGGKGAITARQWEEFRASREKIKAAGNDQDYVKRKADEIMGGLGGALENLKGSVENLNLAMGNAVGGLAKFSFDKIGAALDGVSNLGSSALLAGAAIGTLGLGVGKIAGTVWLLSRVLSGGTALLGSAAALDGSAAALTAAAAKLGASGGPSLPGGVDPKKDSRKLLGGIGWNVPTAVGIAAGIGAYLGIRVIGEANEKRYEGVAPGEVHNRGQEQRRAGNQRIRDQWLEERRRLGIVGNEAGTEAGTQAGDGIASGVTASKPKVEEAARSVMGTIRSILGIGVDVPVRVNPASPAVPTPAPNKQSSAPQIRGGNIHVVVNGAGGNPDEIADKVSRRIAEVTKSTLRGAYSDSDLA